MKLLQNVSLKSYNSFGMDVQAEYFTTIEQLTQIQEISESCKLPEKKSVLGGGSNILFTKNVEGLLIKNELKGIRITEENNEHIWLEVMAGEVWHELVLHTIDLGYGGLENLSLIPGRVGAAPMQNIGAYGVEVKDVIEEVIYWDWKEKEFQRLKNKDCKFGYRESIFKNKLKDKTLITSVIFKLNKKTILNTSYGAIKEELEKMGVSKPSVKSVSEAVIAIRSSKLPNPAHIGNAGSFFKNPTVQHKKFSAIQTNYPQMPFYKLNDGFMKLPAGWLIEQCGWKGYRKGNIGVHEKQALVLVNHGGGKGKDIYDLSEEILETVKEKFGITLEREVQIW